MQQQAQEQGKEFTAEEKMAILSQMMPPSVDQLIRQLEDLVRTALDAEHAEVKKPIPFAKIMQDLALIKRALDIISDDQETVTVLLNHLKANYPELRDASQETKEQEKQLHKLKGLQDVCESARDRLHEQLTSNPQTERALKEMVEESTASPKRKVTRRKNKFRSMGGEKWIKS